MAQARVDRFISDIYRSHIQAKLHFDSKANWILGISAVMMSFFFPQVAEGITLENLGYAVIFLSALASFLISLLIFEPPKFMKPFPHSKKTVMYYKSFKDMTPQKYYETLRNVKTEDDITKQYAYDIANLAIRCVEVKNKLIIWPTYLLFFGTLIGASLVIIL